MKKTWRNFSRGSPSNSLLGGLNKGNTLLLKGCYKAEALTLALAWAVLWPCTPFWSRASPSSQLWLQACLTTMDLSGNHWFWSLCPDLIVILTQFPNLTLDLLSCHYRTAWCSGPWAEPTTLMALSASLGVQWDWFLAGEATASAGLLSLKEQLSPCCTLT